MKKIKSFIYLDEYKMYSISSQIFEGITESLMSYQGSTTKKGEEQKGEFGSGRIMADILKSESGTQEKKFLHDYSYKLFEDYLKESEKILNLSAENIDQKIEQIEDAGFVAVRGKAVFNDMNIIKSTLENYKPLVEALAYITSFEELKGARQQLETEIEVTKDRNQKAKLKQQLKGLTNIKNLVSDQELYQYPDFLEKLTFVLDYGFQDQFVVQMPIEQYTFSAECKREDFRESEHLLIRKYSRFTEKEFVLVGTITQSSRELINREDDTKAPHEPEHMKKAIMNIVEALFAMESSFSGKLVNEIIVDPIAIYLEI